MHGTGPIFSPKRVARSRPHRGCLSAPLQISVLTQISCRGNTLLFCPLGMNGKETKAVAIEFGFVCSSIYLKREHLKKLLHCNIFKHPQVIMFPTSTERQLRPPSSGLDYFINQTLEHHFISWFSSFSMTNTDIYKVPSDTEYFYSYFMSMMLTTVLCFGHYHRCHAQWRSGAQRVQVICPRSHNE